MITQDNTTFRDVEDEVYTYTYNRLEIAKGTRPLYVIEDYLNKVGEDLEEQEWRDVVDNNLYEVSNLGIVRNKETQRVIAPSFKHKYEDGDKSVWRLRVNLSKEGKSEGNKIHELVMSAFVGERPEGKVIGHKNDIPIDNRLSNLEYVTQEENSRTYRVLEELHRGYINKDEIDFVYSYVAELLEDIAGTRNIYIELTDDELKEISLATGHRPTFIREVYKHKKGKESIFDDFVRADETILKDLIVIGDELYSKTYLRFIILELRRRLDEQ